MLIIIGSLRQPGLSTARRSLCSFMTEKVARYEKNAHVKNYRWWIKTTAGFGITKRITYGCPKRQAIQATACIVQLLDMNDI